MDQSKTNQINIDGVSHDISEFSPGIQQAVMIYNKFTAQLQDQQLEVLKTKAALQQVGTEITEAIKKEVSEKNEKKSSEHVTNGAGGEPHSSDE